MKRVYAILGALAVFGAASAAFAAPGRYGSSRGSVRGTVRSGPASHNRGFVASRPAIRTRGWVASRPAVRTRGWATSRHRVITPVYRHRGFRPAVTVRHHWPRVRYVAPAPVVSYGYACAGPVVYDAWGRAMCSTTGALLYDSAGNVIYRY